MILEGIVGWLVAEVGSPSVRGMRRLVAGSPEDKALRKVVATAVETSATAMSTRSNQRDHLIAALKEGGQGRIDAADLRSAVAAWTEPLRGYLSQNRLDRDGLVELLHDRITAGIEKDAREGGPLKPMADWLAQQQLLELGKSMNGKLNVLVGELGEATQRPFSLPTRVGDFTGRVAALTTLRMLARPGQVVALHGMAGVGKSTLVTELAWGLAEEYPDGAICLRLGAHTPGEAPMEPEAALEQLLDEAGVPATRIPTSLPRLQALWRTTLARRRMIIMLDDADRASQVRALLPGSPGCLILVTSRRMLTELHESQPVALEIFEHAESRALLQRVLGEARCAAESSAVDEIVTACEHLPLALRLAVGRLRFFTGEKLVGVATALANERRRLDELSLEDVSVRAAFRVSYDRLNETQRSAFRVLGVHPGPTVSAQVLGALTGRPLAEGAAVLRELTEYHLVEYGRLHDLVRIFAVERAANELTEAEHQAALDRLVDSFECTAFVADLRIRPWDVPPWGESFLANWRGVEITLITPEDARAWFETEAWNMVACVEMARAGKLASVIGDHLRTLGLVRESARCTQVALTWAREHGQHAVEGVALRALGSDALERGRLAEAAEHYGAAHVLAESTDDVHALAGAIGGLADVSRARGELDEAEQLYLRAQEQAVRADSPTNLVRVLSGLGEIAHHRGDQEQARAAFETARELCEQIGDSLGAASMLRWLAMFSGAENGKGFLDQAREISAAFLDEHGRIGAMYGQATLAAEAGQLETARAAFLDTLDQAEAAGAHTFKVGALLGLSKLDLDAEDLQAAGSWASMALQYTSAEGDDLSTAQALLLQAAIESGSGNSGRAYKLLAQALPMSGPATTASILLNLGAMAMNLGDLPLVYDHLRQCANLHLGRDNLERLDDLLGGLGRLATDTGLHELAAHTYRLSVETCAAIGDPSRYSQAVLQVGSCLRHAGDLKGAEQAYQEAARHGSPADYASAKLAMAATAVVEGESEHAGRLIAEALAIAIELGDSQLKAEVLRARGTLACQLGEFQTATRDLTSALDLHREVGHEPGMSVTLLTLAQVAEALGDIHHAVAHLEEATDLYTEHDDRQRQVGQWHRLAQVSDADLRLRCLRGMAATTCQIGDLNGEHWAQWELGYAHWSAGQAEAAIDNFTRVMELVRQRGDRPAEATVLLILADLALGLGDLGGSRDRLDEAAPLVNELRDLALVAMFLVRRANLLGAKGNAWGAARDWLDARQIYRELGDPEAETIDRFLADRGISEENGSIVFTSPRPRTP